MLAAPEDSRFSTAAGLRGVHDRHRAGAGHAGSTSRGWASTSTSSSRGAPPRSSRPCWPTRIVEATETGSTLRANRLRIIDTVLESNTQLIANAPAWADPWKRTKIENIALLLQAAIEAQGRVGLMLNVRREDLRRVLALLPALRRPTISPLSDDEWVARQHDHRGAHGARPDPAAQGRRRRGHRRVPAQQDRDVSSCSSILDPRTRRWRLAALLDRTARLEPTAARAGACSRHHRGRARDAATRALDRTFARRFDGLDGGRSRCRTRGDRRSAGRGLPARAVRQRRSARPPGTSGPSRRHRCRARGPGLVGARRESSSSA